MLREAAFIVAGAVGIPFPEIRYLDGLPLENHAGSSAYRLERAPFEGVLGELRVRAALRYGPEAFAIAQVEKADVGAAELGGALEDRLEHRPQIGRRAAYDAKDLACRGLLLECLPGLVEQPDVVDRP